MDSKVEVGAGEYPQPEYNIHCDIRYPLPCQELCFDIRHIPFKTASISEIRAAAVIEHIHWYEVARVLSELYRVLKPGGILRMHTINLVSLAKALLKQEYDFPIPLMCWFYGGEDYEENTHKGGFTMGYLRQLLGLAGFKESIIVNSGCGMNTESYK